VAQAAGRKWVGGDQGSAGETKIPPTPLCKGDYALRKPRNVYALGISCKWRTKLSVLRNGREPYKTRIYNSHADCQPN